MKLYKDKWDPDLYRQSLVDYRKEVALRQARENAAELETIDRELTALETWLKEVNAT